MREKPLCRPKNPPFRLPAAPGCLRTGLFPPSVMRPADGCPASRQIGQIGRMGRKKRVERMGRSEWMSGPNGWAESNGWREWREWREPAGCGGLRRFACAECAKKSNPEGRSDTSSRPFGGEGRPGYRLFFSRKMFRWASSGLRRSSSTNSKSRMTSASASR